MELGYGRNLPFSKGIAQEATLHEKRPTLKVWVEGRGAESLAACITAFRKRPGTLHIAGDLRILGDTKQEFVAAYKLLKGVGIIIHDDVSDERSDKDGVEMQARASAMLQYSNAMGGSRKTARVRGSRGGTRKGMFAALKRAEKFPEESVRKFVAARGRVVTYRLIEEVTGISVGTLGRHYTDKETPTTRKGRK